MFFITFFPILILLKNCFNKFISRIFTSINSCWLSKSIINTKNFVSKTTRNMIFVFFCVRIFINFSTFSITLKIGINVKWNWYLFKIIFKLDCSFFYFTCAPLTLKQSSLCFVNTFSLLKYCKQLLQNHF